MFERTRPVRHPELMRVSDFQRYLEDLEAAASRIGREGPITKPRWGAIGASMLADLRGARKSDDAEPLEVLAACVRHGRRVTLHLQCDEFAIPLTVFPTEQLLHCPEDLLEFLYTHLSSVRVLMVEPAMLRPPAPDEQAAAGEVRLHHALGAVLWKLALRGLRTTLLPEIAGPAAFRITPGLDVSGLALSGAEAAAVFRLRRESATARAVADWPGFDRLRAACLLNGLYLQSGLIVSRSHPSAIRDSWFSGLGAR
ncbi:MAG: hypothetical protein MUC74_02695 [Ideonella sp.]|jgi:hypothetical protein|nr:hypothetical protein [Ideonella sp.]